MAMMAPIQLYDTSRMSASDRIQLLEIEQDKVREDLNVLERVVYSLEGQVRSMQSQLAELRLAVRMLVDRMTPPRRMEEPEESREPPEEPAYRECIPVGTDEAPDDDDELEDIQVEEEPEPSPPAAKRPRRMLP